MSIKLAHISDTHSTHGKEFMEGPFNLMVETVNMSDADLVVHTGDITGGGLKEEFPFAKKLLSKIKKPLIVLVGNHDSRNVGTELFAEYIGPIRGVYTNDDLDLFVVWIDSTVPDQNDGRVGSLQFNWLHRQLIAHQHYGHKIVALHHHLLPVPHAGRERNVLNNAGDLLSLFRTHDVNVVLCGHRHFPNVYHVEDMVISNAGCASCRKTRMGDINSYNWINLANGYVSVEIRRVDGDIVRYPKVWPAQRIFKPPEQRLIRIGHMAGTYLGPGSYIKQKFENAVRKLNSLKPDIVVHCGSIVNQGREEDYHLASHELSRIKAPILFAPGPRDINYLGHFLYPRYIGSQWQKLVTDQVLFQGLNTCQYDSGIGVMGIWGMEELRDILVEHEKLFRTVFLHHNVVPIPHIRERGLLEDAGDLLFEFTRSGVDLVLTGCSSYPSALKVEGTVVINANTVSSKNHRSPWGCSFNVIDIYKDAIVAQEVHSLWGSRRTLGVWQREPLGPSQIGPKERKRTHRELIVGRVR